MTLLEEYHRELAKMPKKVKSQVPEKILDYLSGEPKTVNEVATAIGISKSSANRILKEMREDKLIKHQPLSDNNTIVYWIE
jgi:predicted transcriptional regulator